MTKTTEDTPAVRELVSRARQYNNDIGNYVEHFINEQFNYSVRLDNNHAVKVSRILAQDFGKMPNILTEKDLQNIAESFWKLS